MLYFSYEDELSAGNNVPKTPTDDEVEPTPIMPINGGGETNGTESLDEKKGSIVKGAYHRHPSANAGYGDKSIGESTEVINEFNPLKFVWGGLKAGLRAGFNALPGNKAAKVVQLTAGGLVFLVVVGLPAMRVLVSHWYMGRAKLADALEQQANLIELNALEVESKNDTLSEEQKAKVVEKQKKWAERLRKLAQFIAIRDKKASKDAKKEMDEQDKKNKSKDVQQYTDEDDQDNDDLF